MRRFTTFPVGPDVLTLAAVIALAALVYLCSLPSTFQSLSHREAGAAELMGQARERIVKEGALFASLVRAADEQTAAKLRQQLIDNERAFHEVASEFAVELPENKAQVESLVSRFDSLAATGWQAAATAPQSPPEVRQNLLQGLFSETLEQLREESQQIELSLHAQDAAYRIEIPGLRKRLTVSI